MSSLWRPLLPPPGGGTGPIIARSFHMLLAICFMGAFLSLGAQLEVLIGSRGLLPLAPLLEELAERGDVGFTRFPTLFWLGASDAALDAGIVIGVVLSGAALLGLRPRLCFVLLSVLYLSYATAGRDFLSFQWDNLLIECGVLASLLPTRRAAPAIHWLLRLVLFKLYWESGIAKWQSALHDWQDGSAMAFYYETAPIPTPLARIAHQLPEAWHALESWAALGIELVVPLMIFGPLLGRRAAFIVLGGFQILNMLTANYGFFCYLTLALHVFLLDDALLKPLFRRLRLKLPSGSPAPARYPRVRAILTMLLCTAFIGLSLLEGLRSFAPDPGLQQMIAPIRRLYGSFRVVNAYHLFGHVTRERIEPEFQTLEAGTWQAHALRYKPGPVDRSPPFVAPHQPRVDFQLWFYGLSYRRATPLYVRTLLTRLCEDPAAVATLFSDPLPSSPEAVRIVFWRYRFAERGAEDPWTRTQVSALRPKHCPGSRLDGT